MNGTDSEGDVYVPTLWGRIEPVVTTIANWAMMAGFGVAFLAAAYLIFGIVGGGLAGFDSLTHDERLRVLANVALGAQALEIGLTVGALGAAIAFFATDTIGYYVFGIAALVGVGVPFLCRMTSNGQSPSFGTGVAIASFIHSGLVPGIIGALLIARDIVKRLIEAIQNRPINHVDLTYGGDALAAPKPVRTSLLAKCWEGPYCRDFIRPHCPIFLSRKACWREKRGCYCEEEIVSNAAAKVNGIVLDMAPDPAHNYANAAKPVGGGGYAPNVYRKPELSAAQKVQRCKYCVIYNEHEREKYKLLVPVVMIGTVLLCILFSTVLRDAVGGVLGFTQGIVDRFTFNSSTTQVPTTLTHPGEAVEWIFVGAFTIMIVSKALQFLEWMCFTAKI